MPRLQRYAINLTLSWGDAPGFCISRLWRCRSSRIQTKTLTLGAGHATVAGACVTILKAWFKESTTIAGLGVTPVEATDDGLGLVTYLGGDAGNLTVGGELNKIASNVAIGRDIAGVHWRSDATESLKLGEQLAIGILRDQRACYNENFASFTLRNSTGQP